MRWRKRIGPPGADPFSSLTGESPESAPVVGRIQPKARVSVARWNLKEAGCGNRLTTGKSLA